MLHFPDTTMRTTILGGLALALLASACGGGGGGSGTSGVPSTDPTPGPACEQFDGTFAAIQKVVFENKGCTQDVCHGSARSGGLDLRQGAAYANLLQVASTGSPKRCSSVRRRVVSAAGERPRRSDSRAACTIPTATASPWISPP